MDYYNDDEINEMANILVGITDRIIEGWLNDFITIASNETNEKAMNLLFVSMPLVIMQIANTFFITSSRVLDFNQMHEAKLRLHEILSMAIEDGYDNYFNKIYAPRETIDSHTI